MSVINKTLHLLNHDQPQPRRPTTTTTTNHNNNDQQQQQRPTTTATTDQQQRPTDQQQRPTDQQQQRPTDRPTNNDRPTDQQQQQRPTDRPTDQQQQQRPTYQQQQPPRPTNNNNLCTGLSITIYSLLSVFLYSTSTLGTLTSLPTTALCTLPNFHFRLIELTSWIITTSPTLTFLFSTCHFCWTSNEGK